MPSACLLCTFYHAPDLTRFESIPEGAARESSAPDSMAWDMTAALVDVSWSLTEPSQLADANSEEPGLGRYEREVIPSENTARDLASGGGCDAMMKRTVHVMGKRLLARMITTTSEELTAPQF